MADPLLQKIASLFCPIVRYRQGSPTDVSELLRVNAPLAGDILVASTSENGNLSDLKAISALLLGSKRCGWGLEARAGCDPIASAQR